MTTRMFGFAMLAAAAAAAPASAQRSVPAIELTPSVGYMMFGAHVDGPLGTDLRNANAPFYAVQVTLNPSDWLGLYASGGYARSDLEIGLPVLGGVGLASSDVTTYDAGVELRAPLASGARAFVQAGVGAMRYEIDAGFLQPTATNTSLNIGAGLEYGLGRNFGVRLAAKDHIGAFDIEEASFVPVDGKSAHHIAVSVGLRVGF